MEFDRAAKFWFEEDRPAPAQESKRAGGPAGYGWEARRAGRRAEISAAPAHEGKRRRRRAETIPARFQRVTTPARYFGPCRPGDDSQRSMLAAASPSRALSRRS